MHFSNAKLTFHTKTGIIIIFFKLKVKTLYILSGYLPIVTSKYILNDVIILPNIPLALIICRIQTPAYMV